MGTQKKTNCRNPHFNPVEDICIRDSNKLQLKYMLIKISQHQQSWWFNATQLLWLAKNMGIAKTENYSNGNTRLRSHS